jgi:hypothetical protein
MLKTVIIEIYSISDNILMAGGSAFILRQVLIPSSSAYDNMSFCNKSNMLPLVFSKLQ